MKRFRLGSVLLTLSACPAAASGFDQPATPPGITLQALGKAQGYDLGKQTAATILRDEIAFADAHGLTLYFYDRDLAGKATCTDACARSWLPAIAPKGAKPMGAWSVIARNDGVAQWALRGKPLYRYVKDVDPGSTWGNSQARFGARRKNGAGAFVGGGERGAGFERPPPDSPPEEGWHVALAYPDSTIALPAGIAIREIPDALAFVLVDWRGHTLYTTDDRSAGARSDWRPAPAPQLGDTVTDFAAVVRTDGITQWAYEGRPLYTFDGDLTPGDANGIDKAWSAAVVYRPFAPPGVQTVNTLGQGKVLATASGRTLYRRDGYIFQSGGGHSLRRGQPPRPAVGRDIGTDAHCSGACAEHWHPFLAPREAQPQGFWDVATRSDGAKQWVYQGYALWTYDGDRKPGDINGNDVYDIQFAGSASLKTTGDLGSLDVGTPMDGTPGLYWAIATP